MNVKTGKSGLSATSVVVGGAMEIPYKGRTLLRRISPRIVVPMRIARGAKDRREFRNPCLGWRSRLSNWMEYMASDLW